MAKRGARVGITSMLTFMGQARQWMHGFAEGTRPQVREDQISFQRPQWPMAGVQSGCR